MRVAGLIIGIFGAMAGFVGAILALLVGGIDSALGGVVPINQHRYRA